MGPVLVKGPSSQPTKRKWSDSQEMDDSHNSRPAKQQRRHYVHHHSFESHQTNLAGHDTSLDRDTVDQLLSRSIGLMLKQSGFEASDPVALESFRAATEEYMFHVCEYIRQSMLNCRRTQPIPQDFEYALQANNITLTSLKPHLHTLVPISISQPELPLDAHKPKATSTLPFLGPELSASDNTLKYIPSHFPQLPSKHTYKASPVYTERENDPAMIRRKATKEGKLGEEALRKLIASSKRDSNKAKEGRHKNKEDRAEKIWEDMMREVSHGRPKKRLKRPIRDEAEILLERFNGATNDHSSTLSDSLDMAGGGQVGSPGVATTSAPRKIEIGPIVNAERRYWRKSRQGGAQRPPSDKAALEAHDATVLD